MFLGCMGDRLGKKGMPPKASSISSHCASTRYVRRSRDRCNAWRTSSSFRTLELHLADGCFFSSPYRSVYEVTGPLGRPLGDYLSPGGMRPSSRYPVTVVPKAHVPVGANRRHLLHLAALFQLQQPVQRTLMLFSGLSLVAQC